MSLDEYYYTILFPRKFRITKAFGLCLSRADAFMVGEPKPPK